jgi:ribose/xylose/arabinose/galactoside ABC-type transport system permease subunit
MKKNLGILGLLVAVCVVTAVLSGSFLSAYNIENVLRRSALFGILSIGVGFVIITGGIDLSLGSVVCLVGCGGVWCVVLVCVGVCVCVCMSVCSCVRVCECIRARGRSGVELGSCA